MGGSYVVPAGNLKLRKSQYHFAGGVQSGEVEANVLEGIKIYLEEWYNAVVDAGSFYQINALPKKDYMKMQIVHMENLVLTFHPNQTRA